MSKLLNQTIGTCCNCDEPITLGYLKVARRQILASVINADNAAAHDDAAFSAELCLRCWHGAQAVAEIARE